MESEFVGFAYDLKREILEILEDKPFSTDVLASYLHPAWKGSFGQSLYFDAPPEEKKYQEIDRIWVRFQPNWGDLDEEVYHDAHPRVWYERPPLVEEAVCYVLRDGWWVEDKSDRNLESADERLKECCQVLALAADALEGWLKTMTGGAEDWRIVHAANALLKSYSKNESGDKDDTER
jgi:hypothetical protein